MDLAKINVFDKEMNFLGKVDRYKSLIYVRKWQSYGNFEFHVPKPDPTLYADGNLIILDEDPERCGVIRYSEDDEYYAKEATIKGFSLLYLLSDRLTVPPAGEGYRVFNSTPVEDIIYALVKENAVDKRPIERLRLGESQHRGGSITFQTRYKVLSDEIETLCRQSGLGARITMNPDTQTFHFEVVEGVDRSYDNDLGDLGAEPYIFAKKFGNVRKRNYTHSSVGAKTTAYVAGQGEGENREIIILGDDLTDVDRREVFIDARDIEQGASTALEDRGAAKLKEYQATDSFEFEVFTRDYRKKWDLGDITTFHDKDLDYLDNNQIVEIQETYEADGIKIEATFGDPVKTITDVVKSTSEEIKTESRTSVGGDKTYTHTQTTPAMKWTVQHNLGKFPSCTITDSAGTVVIGEVKHMDKNTVEIVFSAQFAGKAFLN